MPSLGSALEHESASVSINNTRLEGERKKINHSPEPKPGSIGLTTPEAVNQGAECLETLGRAENSSLPLVRNLQIDLITRLVDTDGSGEVGFHIGLKPHIFERAPDMLPIRPGVAVAGSVDMVTRDGRDWPFYARGVAICVHRGGGESNDGEDGGAGDDHLDK